MRATAVVLSLCLLAPSARGDARSDFFLRMLGDRDERVRLSAALRLAELRAADSVQGVLDALRRETHGNTRAALLGALLALGDPRGLEPARALLQDPVASVRAQAARVVAALSTRRGEALAPAPARTRVAVGSFRCAEHPRSGTLQTAAREALVGALAERRDVAVVTSPEARSLRGFVLDGSIQGVARSEGAVRVTVSLVAQTFPGREYRFDVTASSTVASALDPGAAEVDAVRQAVRNAAGNAVDQFARTP
ncbi:MAG: hypothetical protein HY909_07485 [Deltaproteobacteria bacterium]|nr:hypothetical protein [Deltaproteobacteria bacterium]